VRKYHVRSIAILLAALSARAGALESFRYPVGTISSPIVVGADGNIWYGIQNGIGRVTLDGQVQTFPLGTNLEFDFVALGPDGNVWTVERYLHTLYAITPSGAVAHTFTLPGDWYGAMTAGADGKLWIASHDMSGNTLTAVEVQGYVTSYPVAAEITGLAGGPDGKLWAVSFGAQVLHADLSGSVAPFDMPYEGSSRTSGNAVVAGPDGKMWFSANLAGCIFSPCYPTGGAMVSMTTDGTGTLHQPPNNTFDGTFGIAFGADSNPWLLETRFNPDTYNRDPVLLRMTQNGAFTSYPLHTFASSLVRDSNGSLWFVDISGAEIVRIAIPADLTFSDGFDVL
jgi:streptogramin lyase